MENQELVYFLDPNDGSEPDDLSTQIIHVMSYQTLTHNINDIFQRVDSDNGQAACNLPATEGGNDYAWYA